MANDEITMHAAKTLRDDLNGQVFPGGDVQAQAHIQVFLNELLDAQTLTSNPAKVSGYTAQPDAKVALVNEFKADEERLLRKLDALASSWADSDGAIHTSPTGIVFQSQGGPAYDQRWLAIARTHINEGFMALNRAVFQPTRIKLPEDEVHRAHGLRPDGTFGPLSGDHGE